MCLGNTHLILKCDGKASYCCDSHALSHTALSVGREWPFKLHIMDSLWAFVKAEEPK